MVVLILGAFTMYPLQTKYGTSETVGGMPQQNPNH